MGIMGQLPQAPDELPGSLQTTGEPPEPHRGPRADELPTLGPAQSRTISVSLPVTAAAPGGEDTAS